MSGATRGRATLAATVVMFGLAAFLSFRGDRRFLADAPQLDISEDGERVVFGWSGPIAAPLARRFAEAFEASRGQARIIVIDLDSPGGSLGEGKAVIAEIEKMKRTHTVETRVGRGAECLSMCVPIYLRGDRRTAAADAQFMFHEPTTREVYTDREVNKPAFEQRLDSERFFRRYFEQSDMDPAWRDALKSEWRGRDVWRTARELVDEGANVVQEVD